MNSNTRSERRLSNGQARCLAVVLWAFVFSFFLLLVIILPLSFSYLEYNELGLRKGRVTGSVDTSRVYDGGRHVLGPSYVFQKYPASVHTVQVSNVSVVSSDRLETDLDITIMYFLDPARLGQLQKEFNLRYETIVRARALSAIKNTAVQFTTEQFFLNRTMVVKALHDAVRADLETNLYVKVPYVYLAALRIPQVVAGKQLQTAIQNQINMQQLYDNQATLVRKDTATMVNGLLNQASVIVQQATANAAADILQASANATRTVEAARTAALGRLFRRLNVTDQTQMEQLDYAYTLLHTDITLHVGYSTLLKSAV